MAIKIVTAKKGEPHVTSADAGALNQGTFGADDYVLSIGEKFRAELVSNNEIKIYDGEGMMQGRHWRIEPGTYESVTIDNGSQGKKRKDLIVARYTKDSSTGVENVELAVLKGTETEGNATAPEATRGDVRKGDLKHEMVLYTVTLDGLNVTAVDEGFAVLMNAVEIKEKIERVKVKFGSMAKHIGTNASSYRMFTMDELKRFMGTSGGDSKQYHIFVTNGDGQAKETHIDGTTWIGTNLYAVFDRLSTGNMRINFCVIYIPQEDVQQW